MAKLTIAPGPPTETHCTFSANRMLHDGHPVRFTCDDDPQRSPAAVALLAVPGVEAVTTAEINPPVAQHGGHVELIDVQDAKAILRMQGGVRTVEW